MRAAVVALSCLALTVTVAAGTTATPPPTVSYAVHGVLSASGGRFGGGICASGPHGHVRVTSPKWHRGSSWSPDGRRLAYSAAGLRVLDERGHSTEIANIG